MLPNLYLFLIIDLTLRLEQKIRSSFQVFIALTPSWLVLEMCLHRSVWVVFPLFLSSVLAVLFHVKDICHQARKLLKVVCNIFLLELFSYYKWQQSTSDVAPLWSAHSSRYWTEFIFCFFCSRNVLYSPSAAGRILITTPKTPTPIHNF